MTETPPSILWFALLAFLPAIVLLFGEILIYIKEKYEKFN